ncbi:H(+)-transporting V1 sector ATPase subunit H, partial [Cyberlindnera jadinii NRRL Y-1542]
MTVDQTKHLQLESTYLDDYRSAIRSKTIPWDGFARSELLTSQQAKQLSELEGATVRKRVEKVLSEEHAEAYASTLFDLLSKKMPQERSDIKKYILVLISDLLDHGEFAQRVLAKDPHTTLNALVEYVDSSDEIVKLLSLYNAVYLLIQPGIQSNVEPSVVIRVFEELNALVDATSFNLKFFALELISDLLAVKPYRPIYWQSHSKFIPNLFQNLNGHIAHNSTESIQFQYKILLSLWLLTFNHKVLVDFSKYYLSETLSLLSLAKSSIKEKIVRLVVSIFINLTSIPANEAINLHNLKYLILMGDILPTLSNLKERKWSDEELIEDLDVLYNSVQDVYSQLTSFDEYLQELDSKQFKNSPVHSNDEFFMDNLEKFQDNNYKVFKQLLKLLDVPHMEPKSLVLVLGDIGRILKLDPKSIEILSKVDKKHTIMDLLNHKNSEVRYQALKATQFIVSQTF